jgi:hypothetical protein
MARVGNDIVVAAYNADRTQVLTRVLTFCGNGVWTSTKSVTGQKGAIASANVKRGHWLLVTALAKIVRFCRFLSEAILINPIFPLECGNGVATVNEDCDGTEGCDPVTCKCQSGYQPRVIQKRCTLAAVSFVPSVGPSLDCLTFAEGEVTSLNLFFSFMSNDPFDQIIEYGPINSFSPSDLAVSVNYLNKKCY